MYEFTEEYEPLLREVREIAEQVVKPRAREIEESDQFPSDMAKRFFPQVMTAYCNGGTEMIILELVISPDAIRPKAEEKFMECLQGFKVMQRKELSKR